MPYCPKCGVEVELRVDNCPLCNFDIPDVGEPKENIEEVFPINPINLYPSKIKEMRNIFYFAISIIIFAFILIMYTLTDIFNMQGVWVDYSVIGLIGTWILCYFLFGFMKSFMRNAAGGIFVGILGCYFIDRVDGYITWFYGLALPIHLVLLAILLFEYYIFKKNRHKVEFFTLALYICGAIATFAIGVQLVVSNFLFNEYLIDWAIIIVIIMVALIILLLGLRYKLPDEIKEKLKRIFHV